MNIKIGGQNISKPAIKVSHASLKRFDEHSAYRSLCPECKEGCLPVGRSHESFELVNVDTCLLCGQTFIYTDESIAGEKVTKVYTERK